MGAFLHCVLASHFHIKQLTKLIQISSINLQSDVVPCIDVTLESDHKVLTKRVKEIFKN